MICNNLEIENENHKLLGWSHTNWQTAERNNKNGIFTWVFVFRYYRFTSSFVISLRCFYVDMIVSHIACVKLEQNIILYFLK